jgi:hypothetical protein
MTFPVGGNPSDIGGPAGHSYAAIVVRLGAPEPTAGCAPADVENELRQLRFTGWLAQPEDGWLPLIPAEATGAVAAGGRGLIGVGECLAGRFGVPVFAFRVLSDRQLLILAWVDGAEIGRYVSDPSQDHSDRANILNQPIGVNFAAAFAAAAGRAEVSGKLTELLSAELDTDNVIESERLASVLELLHLPQWLVAASSLPKDIPTGPRRRELTRIGAGAEGVVGLLRGWATDPLRERRPEPPAVPDPPRRSADIDPWLL